MKRSVLWTLLLAFVVTTASLTPATAVAQDEEEETTTRREFKDTIHVVQRKPVLQAGRLDLAPRFGMSINDSIYQTFKVGTNLNYHISERFYLGGLFDWYNFGDAIGGTTAAFEKIQNETGTAADAAVLNWSGGAELGYTPLYGKFAIFNSGIMYYDLAITAGGLYINAESVALPSAYNTFGGTVAATNRIFFNDWIALNIEVRDVIFSAKLVGTDALTNVVTIGAGVSLYVPTSFEYSEPGNEQ